MVNQINDASAIESPALQANTPSNRRGDGSFDTNLDAARKQLEEKQKYSLLVPWAEVQKMFSIIPLEFKFEFAADKIEDKPRKDQPFADKIKQDNKNTRNNAEVKNDTANTTYYNLTKEALKKNLPTTTAQYQASIPYAFLTDPSSAKALTKSDLKTVIDEIVKKIELIKTNRKAELNLSLYQENLGEMTLLLSLKNGLVSVQIAASLPGAKKILEDNLFELESALKNARISLGDLKIVEVNHGNHPKSDS